MSEVTLVNTHRQLETSIPFFISCTAQSNYLHVDYNDNVNDVALSRRFHGLKFSENIGIFMKIIDMKLFEICTCYFQDS